MSRIALNRLLPHPDNANRMTDVMMKKLAGHIKRTGHYPPLIIRPHPTKVDHYQVLDGHHRMQVLQTLGHEDAHCEIWDITEDETILALLTLNRLEGADDPQKRGALLWQLTKTLTIPQIAQLMPDNEIAIAKLIELTKPPPELTQPLNPDDMPHAVTFFLTAPQQQTLFDKLRAVDRDRSQALVSLLNLNVVAK